jgi:hypothetical protein
MLPACSLDRARLQQSGSAAFLCATKKKLATSQDQAGKDFP